MKHGAAKALDGIIPTVERKSCGFRTERFFTAMIDLVASRLEFDLPDPFFVHLRPVPLRRILGVGNKRSGQP